MRVDARSDGRPAKRQLAYRIAQFLETADRKLRLSGVATKLLAQADWRRILQMGPSDLHNRIKLPGFCGKRLVQLS